VMGRGLFCTLFLFLPCCNEFFYDVATDDFQILKWVFWVIATDVFAMLQYYCLRCCSTYFSMLRYIFFRCCSTCFFNVAVHIMMLQYYYLRFGCT
jgi:hypothetical protein